MFDIKEAFDNVCEFAVEHSPEIAMIIGGVAAVGATVLACKATVDIKDELEEVFEDIEETKTAKENGYYDEYPEENYKKDLYQDYKKVVKSVVKHYAFPAALECIALGTIFAGDKELRRRNAGLAASLTTVQTAYSKLSENIVEKYGQEEFDNLRLGLHKEKITREIEDPETGKKKKVKEEVDVIDKTKTAAPDVRVFDESCGMWSKSYGVNRDYILRTEQYFNDLLEARGHVFENEIWDYMDLDLSEPGQVNGWIFDPNAKGKQIDFHLRDVVDPAKANFLNGGERNVIIELTPMGYIADKVFKNPISLEKLQRRFGDFPVLGRG